MLEWKSWMETCLVSAPWVWIDKFAEWRLFCVWKSCGEDEKTHEESELIDRVRFRCGLHFDRE